VAIALCAVGLTACSEGSGTARPATTAKTRASKAISADGYFRGDDDARDKDDLPGETQNYSFDDYGVRYYGKAAGMADTRRVVELVKRYYSAAVARNGGAACSLLSLRLARNLGDTNTIPQNYDSPRRVAVLPGESCARVMSILFEQDHRRLDTALSTLQVTGVRVSGSHGLALLGFRTTPERWIPVAHEGQTWKVDALLDHELP